MHSDFSLEEVPLVVLQTILEAADFRSLINLRKVSFEFRFLIDDFRPCTYLKSITITLSVDNIYISMDPFKDWGIDIEYQKHENGYFVESGRTQKFMKNEHFLDGFFNDLQLNLRNQRDVLQIFRLNFEVFLVGFLERMIETLVSRNDKLRVEEMNLDVSCQEELMSVLPYIDSKSIKKISISSSEYLMDLKMDEVFQLDQWKNADEIEIFNCIISDPIENFQHFSCGRIQIEMVSSEELNILKEAFLQNSNFSSFIIKYKYFNENPELSDFFGDPIIKKQDIWSFPFRDNPEKALLITHYDNHVFNFSRVNNMSSIEDKYTIV